MKRIFVASDPHIGALSFTMGYSVEQITKGIKSSDEAVLCGDIFEARSQTIPHSTRLNWAKKAIDKWGKANPNCTIYFILGNHELPLSAEPEGSTKLAYCAEFVNSLKDYARKYPNMVFVDTPTKQIGDCLFTHGHAQGDHREKSRNYINDLIDSLACLFVTGMAANIRMPKHQHVTEILNKMTETGIKHVFFGHIHQSFNNYQPAPDAPIFHNMGSFLPIGRTNANSMMIEQNDIGETIKIERFRKIGPPVWTTKTDTRPASTSVLDGAADREPLHMTL